MSEPDDPTVAARSPWAAPDGGAGEDTTREGPTTTGTHYDAPSDAGTQRYTVPPGQGPQPSGYGAPPGQHPGYGPPPGQHPGYGPPGQQPGYGPPTAQQQGHGRPQAPGTAVWAPPGAGPSGPPTGWGQPAPGWGGPYPPPPRKPFPWKVVGLVVGALLLIALIVVGLLAFVVGPRFARVDVLDADAVAQGVTRVVTEDWRRQITGVSCPADQEVRPGVRFTCSATVDGRPVQVPVQVVDADGTYSVGQPR
ncbi:DUF4333 domain-containing protein [Actinomycetospora lutea]|uniref:DUF4333 domain-containing protein n=1 Tax=Actinomycetospora lutea TaxID=663604 RepID=UPI0023666592|nr:DUF4333 domain-containing protein [Actinomycetospora lutea]MDD7937369.1 DUF4333 domain-containing protein [Actinomycetospora lutea]